MLNRLGRLTDRVVEGAGISLLVAMLISVFLGVVFRALNLPLAWSDEMAQSLLVWVGFIGWIIASRRGSHIRVTAIVSKLKGRTRIAAEIATHLLVAALGGVMVSESPSLITRNLDVEWVSLPLPVALIYLPVPVAGVAVVLQSCVDIIRALMGDVSNRGGTPE